MTSYIICGTPRSGSTLLCKMLASARAGKPGSFFREPDIAEWADRWQVAHPDGTETAVFDRTYLAAMLAGGRGGTDIFGLRIMWGSVATAAIRFDRAHGGSVDIAQRFQTMLGETPLYIHLSRTDKVAQAISLYRAEQSGLWHLAADGSVIEGETSPQPVTYNAHRIAQIVTERTSDDEAWNRFFADRGLKPVRLTYEAISADPRAALGLVLSALGLDPTIATAIAVPTAKIGDQTNADWAERFRSTPGP
jgi:LPS sulfotransferase NodH